MHARDHRAPTLLRCEAPLILKSTFHTCDKQRVKNNKKNNGQYLTPQTGNECFFHYNSIIGRKRLATLESCSKKEEPFERGKKNTTGWPVQLSFEKRGSSELFPPIPWCTKLLTVRRNSQLQ